MKVLVGIASHETQHVHSIQACYELRREPQDQLEMRLLSRGDLVRQEYANMILADDNYGPDDALLLLDGDQKHPLDMLEKMRAHNLDMVCAHYYKRDGEMVQSMCFEIGNGKRPYKPYDNPPREGLHEIGTTGFGCVLIKKKVLHSMDFFSPEDSNMMETDFIFFHKARQYGFKLWLDASIESEHAVTIWLNHKTAERLKDD
jgi:hypothetical protein